MCFALKLIVEQNFGIEMRQNAVANNVTRI